jgi:sarcosine oxidase
VAEPREFDHVVVGLGGIGSAAAYWLSRTPGAGRVLGLERFEIGHPNGASEDHSRIIRRSYHAPRYVELAAEAYRAWADLEADLGESLLVRTGGLDLFPAGSAIASTDYEESMAACGVPFEAMDGTEAMRRWPQWHGLGRDMKVLYQADTGIAPASRCNDAHRTLAREHGATLRDRTRVTRVRDGGGGDLSVEFMNTDGRRETVRCGSVVLAADSWTNELLDGFDLRLPLTTTKEQVIYFDAPDADAFAPERFPVWIWMDIPSFYGFPAFGLPGPKAAQDVGGPEVTPDTRSFEPDPDAFDRVTAFVAKHLPGAAGVPLQVKTCLYTLTPDRDFVLDRVPGHPKVLMALGAAHGFKFASWFGRVLAELAVTRTTASDISAFAADRELLIMKAPPKTFIL